MKLFITSTGRAGSRYIYQALRDTGLKMGNHERSLGFDGGVINFGFLQESHFQTIQYDSNFYKIHLVRHPVRCISSLTTTNSKKGPVNRRNDMFNDILKLETDVLRRSMLYYYHVNTFLCTTGSFNIILRLEDNISMFKTVSRDTKLFDYDNFLIQSERYGRKHNSRKHHTYTWEDLEKKDITLTTSIKELSQKLGYEN